MSISEIVNLIAAVATAAGVIFAAVNLLLSYRQSLTDFEDAITTEYRKIIKDIPMDALLGKELCKEDHDRCRNQIYNYLDLTNEQVFLRKAGRVRKSTWEQWVDGIKVNLERKAFDEVWNEVKDRAEGSFEELRRLEEGNFKTDPRSW